MMLVRRRLLPKFLISHKSFSSSSSSSSFTVNPNEEHHHLPPSHPSAPRGRSAPDARPRTPSEKRFDSWVDRLRPGFTAADLAGAIRSATDPDLAHDLFHWASLRPGFRHTAESYLALLRSLLSCRRYSAAESVASDALSGACPPDGELYNAIIRFSCSRKHLFSQAFDAFKKMQRAADGGVACRPSVETYSMLLNALVRRFGNPPVSYIYLRSVKSLVRQMKASGLVPDAMALNLVIKAYSRCLDMDEAVRVFKEMQHLYGCEPNGYSFGYIAKGLCEKDRVEEGFAYFKQMREKGFVPTSSVYMAVICGLAMSLQFELAVEAMFDMLGNGMRPDVLTYRTLLEGLCRDGEGDRAFSLLEDIASRPGAMPRMMYSDLLDGLHWLCNQPKE